MPCLARHAGYCSIVAFEDGELGTPLPPDQAAVYTRPLLTLDAVDAPVTPTQA
jgi:hypothetical protein